MLLRVALLRTDVSEERSGSIIRVIFRSLRQLLVRLTFLDHQFVTLMMEAQRSSETSVLTRATWRNIPEDGILQNINYLTTSQQIFTSSSVLPI
jgi:hypothetical protein